MHDQVLISCRLPAARALTLENEWLADLACSSVLPCPLPPLPGLPCQVAITPPSPCSPRLGSDHHNKEQLSESQRFREQVGIATLTLAGRVDKTAQACPAYRGNNESWIQEGEKGRLPPLLSSICKPTPASIYFPAIIEHARGSHIPLFVSTTDRSPVQVGIYFAQVACNVGRSGC